MDKVVVVGHGLFEGFEGFEGFERVEGFEGFEGFVWFEGFSFAELPARLPALRRYTAGGASLG